MSVKQLLDTPLTLYQARHAAALDDLLRFVAIGEDGKWSVLEKRMAKISYHDLYEIAVADAGDKASPASRVEWIERYFKQHHFNRQETAGMPNSIFKELIAAWKARARDDWTKVSLLPGTDCRSSKVSKVSASCDIGTNHTGKPMKALNVIVIELDDSLTYEKYMLEGFATEAVIQTKMFGTWRLLLGPGTIIRKSCSTCWNARSMIIESPAFTSPTLLCQDIGEGDELYTPIGKDRSSSWICPHPRHEELCRGYPRKYPADSLVSATRVIAPSLISAADGVTEDSVTRASSSTSTPASRQTPSPMVTTEQHPAPPAHLPRIILRFPSHIRPCPPIRTCKLDLKIHRQVVRSFVQLKANRIARRARREVDEAKSKMTEAVITAKKTRLEVNLAEARRARLRKLYERAKVAAKEASAKDARMQRVEAELRADLSKVEGFAGELQRERDEAKVELKKAVKRIGLLDSHIAKLQEQSEEHTGIRAELASVRQRHHQELDALRSTQLSEMSALRAEMTLAPPIEAVADHGASNDELHNQLAAVVEERDKLNAALQTEAYMRADGQALIQVLNNEVQRLRYEQSVHAGGSNELAAARQRIAELQAELDDTWSSFRQVKSELNKLKRAAPGLVRGAFVTAPASRPPTTASYPAAHHSSIQYAPVAPITSPARIPARGRRKSIFTPPLTASPTGSARMSSPGHLMIGSTPVGDAPCMMTESD